MHGRPWALGLASCLWLSAFPAHADLIEPGPEEPMKVGKELYDEADYERALKKFESFKGKGDVEARRLFWKARALAKLKKYDKAVEAVVKARGVAPTFAETFYNEACYRALSGETDKAFDALYKFFHAIVKERTWTAKRTLTFAEQIETDADLAKLRGEARFESSRAAAAGAARLIMKLEQDKVKKKLAEHPLYAEFQALGDKKAGVCVVDPFGVSGGSGRCAAAACPDETHYVVVKRAAPVGAKALCASGALEI